MIKPSSLHGLFNRTLHAVSFRLNIVIAELRIDRYHIISAKTHNRSCHTTIHPFIYPSPSINYILHVITQILDDIMGYD